MKRTAIGLLFLLFSVVAASAANRFAVCTTTCTWDGASTAMWSTTPGGATGASVPGAADDVVLDAATCVGGTTCTITVNTNFTVLSVTMGACTASTTGCVLDFSVNNNSPAMTGNSGGFSNTGTGTRRLNMGNGTWTISGSSNAGVYFNQGTDTNLTFNANSSTVAFSGSGGQSFNFGTKTMNAVTVGSRTSNRVLNQSPTGHSINTLTLTAPLYYNIATTGTQLINTALVAIGTSTNQIMIKSQSDGTAANLTSTATLSCTYCGFKDIAFSGGGSLTANSSLNLGNNSGVTFGGGGGCILGGWLLWRDMPNNLNDNFPAWLDKAA